MKNLFTHKFMIVGGLMLLLLIPLKLISGIIDERTAYRDSVYREISSGFIGQQEITAAILVVPYYQNVSKEEKVYAPGGGMQTVITESKVLKHKYFLPESLSIAGIMQPEERYRGIYRVPIYTTQMKAEGRFELPKHLGLTEELADISWETPYIAVGILDIRGITRNVELQVSGRRMQIQPGTEINTIPQGVHADIPLNFSDKQSIDFSLDMELQGLQNLAFRPVGKYTTVKLTSPWPHPSFTGRYLPKERSIGSEGFTALWETSFFASNMEQLFAKCVESSNCSEFRNDLFGVSLHQGVDIYQQAERSLKYALLFVGLTFVLFFLFEMLKGLKVHPIQYGLVGVALALFYLLLLSLSEHLAFATSYLIASAACVMLLGFYVSFVLRSAGRGLMFSTLLGGLYGALYMLLGSEDYALLMGSGLVFAILTAIMVFTRHVDWYALEGTISTPKARRQPTEGKEINA